jgi:pyrimidine deaminase RibD-like protein
VIGEIVDQEVRFVVPLMRPDFDLPAFIAREVSQINWRLDHLRFNADMFNADLEHVFKAYIAARRKKMVEHDSIVGNLGIPVRQAAAPSPAESRQSASKPETARERWKLSKSASGAPRALLSYSWDGPQHKQWIKEFAERLQGESGVEIIFDGWRLNPGDDKLHFMEQAVAKSDFVIVVCTPAYSERANKREGGVGYESMIITSALAEHILTNKFIPVLRKGSWNSSLPIYLKSRIGVNLSDEPYREDEYEKLLRVLHGEPIQPPPIASKPDFSKKSASSVKQSSVVNTIGTAPDEEKNQGDRLYAAMAVEEARKSVAEDGRTHPKVGAIVVKDGRVLSKAYRGEILGSHAEYIALEDKLRDDLVAGATVYTTLEPCTTRNHPKIPCAERLIARKVRRVVIGMLGPDPRISGKGVRKLRSANIIIDLFPTELADQVEELNREFMRKHETTQVAEPTQARIRLTEESRKEMIAALRPFALSGRIIDLVKYADDTAVADLAYQLSAVPRDAGWKPTEYTRTSYEPLSGLLMEIDPKNAITRAAADALLSALSDAGLSVSGPVPSLPHDIGFGAPSGAGAAIRLTIGAIISR